MSFLNKLTAFLPLGKRPEKLEYFFAINIGTEILTTALWTIEGKELKIVEVASQHYSSLDEIATATDRLLDQVLGLKEIEPQKILFGVPNSWLSDENLKDEYLKILRKLVKELELTPMAYVATSHALMHFLEKKEGVPTTAILVGFEKLHLNVTVVRAGKLDGVKVITRGESAGSGIEKALLTFTEVETLPSKILIYGQPAGGLKSELLSFSWMSKLSFLHFPKIDILDEDIEIKSVCLAGGSEMNEHISYTDHPFKKEIEKKIILDEKEVKDDSASSFGFVVGDVADQMKSDETRKSVPIESGLEELVVSNESPLEIEDFEQDLTQPAPPIKEEHKGKFHFKGFIKNNFTRLSLLFGIAGVIVLLLGTYLFLVKADVKVFVEPKILEKDAQVIADPNQKTVDEAAKIIPGQIVDVEVSGTAKENATGKKQIGDPAKGRVIIINNTTEGHNFSAGTILTSSSSIKFKLDNSASISATLVDSDSKSKITVDATAVGIGADGNIPSGTNLAIGSYASSQFVAKAEGNFAGGTSKDVTVISSEDTQRLLAKLSSDLRGQAQQKLQEKYPNKKILEEALSENIVRKNYNKNINDQASEFSLDMTVRFKGTAFDDADLKTIVSKLVTTQIPDGFRLDLSETETQADVSELKKDGKLVFLAKFKAKLIPKIDTDKIKSQIKFKTLDQVANMLKGMENVLGSEIKMTPNLPSALQRLPILSKNITIEVGLK